ncbi:chaplin [Streptomyces katsurahamanus]|uniref:Chaplin n=1 Tax=Streptomyces katsurahamanus TaxID=2577098 RepID=A0ABW9NSA8_9ACTN|nr:chaplin [Streptomyces katsurahamanus]MQS36130.1 chaplin [Streptomyces katsurahamanus]
MRKLHRKGLVTVMLTGGALAMAGQAYADSSAVGGAADSPGVIAGNAVQLPVHLPISVCGNTINIAGLLNPTAGNTCENVSSGAGDQATPPQGPSQGLSNTAQSSGGAVAQGGAQNSPGVVSGNGVQLPIDLPVNVSGNSVSVVGALNPALGNASSNISEGPSGLKPPTVAPPKTEPPRTSVPPRRPSLPRKPPMATVVTVDDTTPSEALARTGAEHLGYAVPAAALLLGGTLLYRRGRRAGS